MKLDERVRERATALINKASQVLATDTPNPEGVFGFPTLARQEYANWRSQSLAFLTDLLGPDHVYTKEFREKTKDSAYATSAESGRGILRAVLEDIDQGFIETVRQLIAAELFSDFFEQAEHLLESGYKAPAASLAGAVMENGLRSIAHRNGIQVREKEDLSTLNKKLADKEVYGRLVQRKVQVWTDVRNLADHGRFDEFSEEDVRDLIKGAQSLLADYL